MTSGGKLPGGTAVQVGMLSATARAADPLWVSFMSFKGSARLEAVLEVAPFLLKTPPREWATSSSAPSHLSRGTAIALLGTSQLLISPPNKALLIGKLDQQNCKGIALLLPEGGELCVLMFSRHLPDLLQDLIVILGQLNGVEAPVMRVCSPIHQAPFL
jgi:hypothetical protein